MYRYPVELTELENGSFMARFPDVPEAITAGNSPANALEWAQDALHVALSGYMDDNAPIPLPSQPEPGQPTVEVSPLVAVKLGIYSLMLQHGITRARLARLLHCDARQVRRLLDLDHQSTFDQLLDALEVLGSKLDVVITPLEQQSRQAGGVRLV